MNYQIKRKCFISDCKQYRWYLELDICTNRREIIFIGLNPSLSDNDYLDNTTKKIIKICDTNNYGKIKIINLFGLISSSPKLLLRHIDPIGFLNNKIINHNIKYWIKEINCDLWIGWGNRGKILNRDSQILQKLENYLSIKDKNVSDPLMPLILKKTKKNNPMHPLYCRDDSKLHQLKRF